MTELAVMQSTSQTTTVENFGNIAEKSFLGEAVLELLLPFLHAPELATVARTNQRFFHMVQDRDALWDSTYANWNQEFRMAALRILTQDDLHDPDDFVRFEMRIPPRCMARSTSGDDGIGHDCNHDTSISSPLHATWSRRLCQGHPRDDADYSKCVIPRKRNRTASDYSNDGRAIGRDRDNNGPIYFTDYGVYCHWRVDEAGNLLDFPSNKNSSLSTRREYPVLCPDCSVTLYNTQQLVDHCTSQSHIYRKCPALLDPRRTTAFDSLSRYEQAKAIWHYPKQVQSFFRQQNHQPPNQYRMHQFLGLLEGTIAHVLQRDSIVDSSKDLYPERNVEQVSEYCVEWIVHKAINFDFFNYAKQVAYVGWQAIDFYDSGIGYDLCLSLTGIPPHHFDYLIKD